MNLENASTMQYQTFFGGANVRCYVCEAGGLGGTVSTQELQGLITWTVPYTSSSRTTYVILTSKYLLISILTNVTLIRGVL